MRKQITRYTALIGLLFAIPISVLNGLAGNNIDFWVSGLGCAVMLAALILLRLDQVEAAIFALVIGCYRTTHLCTIHSLLCVIVAICFGRNEYSPLSRTNLVHCIMSF